MKTPSNLRRRSRCTNLFTARLISFQIAAAYAFHIAENQPYIDGNKRTRLLSALNFLAMNGIMADRPVDEFYDAMIAIAEKRLDKAGLAEVFRRHLSR